MLRKIFISFVLILVFMAFYTVLLGQKRGDDYDNHCRAEAWCKQSSTAIKQDGCFEADYEENWPYTPWCYGYENDCYWYIECYGPISGWYCNDGYCSVGWDAMVDVDYW